MITGLLSHLDFCVGDPARSIRFYDALLTALGYERWREDADEWQEPDPSRATWGIGYGDRWWFGIDLRPARPEDRHCRYDRHRPGPHHIAFHVAETSQVDRIHALMGDLGAEILDPPAEYGGRPGYGDAYYALFLADPDGVKLEVVCAPGFGPPGK